MLTVLPRELSPTNVPPSMVAGVNAVAADLNRDGWLDLISGSAGVYTRTFRNSAGGFSSGPTLIPTASRITFGDYDGDGDLDAFLASTTSTGTLLRNETPANLPTQAIFRTVEMLGPTNRIANASWADFDGDGDLDLLADGGANARGTIERVFFARNDGGGRFVRINSPLPSARAPVLTADFDNDGRPDVLVPDADAARHQAVVWRNEGGFHFTATSLQVPAPGLFAAGTADFDGDGRLDLWVQHRRETNSLPTQRILSLWRQTSVGFAEELRVPAEAIGQAGPPAWGDFDGDGTPDFLAPALSSVTLGNSPAQIVSNYFAIYRNNGRGSFTPGRFLFSNVIGGSPAAGDFNRDGLLDAWTPESQGRVFYSQLRDANLPPDAPTGLFALAGGTNVLFTWLPAHDPNQTAPLTYNLRVGTRPGANDVIPSMSLADGTRLLPTPGNAGFATMRRLLLPPVDSDTLYWSVQAVDNSFAGGLWATEQSVSVNGAPGEPPAITGLTNVVMDEDTPRTVTFAVTDDLTGPAAMKVVVTPASSALFPSIQLNNFTQHPTIRGTNYQLLLRPASDAFGEAEFTVVATDARGLATTNRLSVTVRPVNDPPTLTLRRTQNNLAGRPSTPEPFRVEDIDDVQLAVTYRRLGTEDFPLADVQIGGTGTERTLTVVPGGDGSGGITLELTATDSAGEAARGIITVLFQELAYETAARLGHAESWPSPMAWADFDGDGLLELALPSPDGKGLAILKWENGQFTTAAMVGDPAGISYVLKARDFDNDGRIDLLAQMRLVTPLGESSFPLKIFRNLGDFQFEPISGSYSGSFPTINAWWEDLNHDGGLDLLVESFLSDGVRSLLLWRNRDGSLHPEATLAAVSQTACCYGVFDLDGNEAPELTARAALPPLQAINFSYGPEGFVEYAGPAPADGIVAQADFDGDQRPDLITTKVADALWLSWATSEGYTAPQAFASGFNRAGVFIADFDQDGRSDVFWPGQYDGELLRNIDGVAFQLFRTRLTDYGMPGAAVGDFDADGVIDVAGSVQGDPGPHNEVFRGLSRLTNQPPSAPTGLQSQVVNGALQLTWNLATDPNQAGGLTYNLRVGTTPGGNEVWSAESRLDGRRLVPRNGNQGWRTNAVPRGLQPKRTYYWSVQAVDASFAGGPFAPEQSFTAPEPVPRLTFTPAANNRGRLTLRSEVAQQVLLERSHDLRSWETVSSHSLEAAGELEVTFDLQAEGQSVFLRTRPGPLPASRP
jgi:hypothetical protein